MYEKFSGSRHLSTPTFGLLSFGQQAFFFRHLRPLSRLGLSITKTLYYKSNKRPGAFVNSKTPFVPTAPFFQHINFSKCWKERNLEIYPKLCAVANAGLLDLLLLSITLSSEIFTRLSTCQLRHGDTQALLCNMTWGDILHWFHSWVWRNHNGRGVLLGNVPCQQCLCGG